MCRWAAYLGDEVYLEEIVTAPCHSLIDQSHNAQEAKTATNGDGFGLAWYGARAEPGLYRDILPAWSDPNLKSLCQQIRSGLFLAHVRAATDGATSRANCHPFVQGKWSFMHNGHIGQFDRLRRHLENGLSDGAYEALQGTTDSELFFLLMVEAGLDADPLGATRRAVAAVANAAAKAGIDPVIRLTAAFSDGERLHAVRFATDDQAPTLYTAPFGAGGGRCLVSDPFDRACAQWQSIPPGNFVTATRNSMMVQPFERARPEPDFLPQKLCSV